jgi:hypothetical protein
MRQFTTHLVTLTLGVFLLVALTNAITPKTQAIDTTGSTEVIMRTAQHFIYCPANAAGDYTAGCYRDVNDAVRYCERLDLPQCDILKQNLDYTNKKHLVIE